MRRVFLRRLIALGHADQLQKAEPVRVRIAAALGHRVPVIVAETVGILRAVVTQMAEAVVAIDDELNRAGAAGAGYPDWRMRMLDRARPKVNHRQLVVLEGKGKDI